MNRYTGYTQEELEAKLRRVNDAIERGNQTSAGIEPGVKHEFAEKSDAELRVIAQEIYDALAVLDSTTYPPNQRPGRTTPIFC